MTTVDGLITGRELGAAGKPVFESVEEERLHRKQELAAAFRVFGRFGFSEGVAGHITARDPEHPDRFWVNPFGMSFSQIKVSDLILVDHNGEVVEGNRPVNTRPPSASTPRCIRRGRTRSRRRTRTLPARQGVLQPGHPA